MRPPHLKTWAWAAAAASTLAIGLATLHPSGFITRGWSFYLTSGDAALGELIANLILFIPLGISLTLAGVRPVRVVVAGTLLSFTVEFLQQWIPGRDPSVGDIVANSISTALGVLVVVAAPRWLLTPPRTSRWQALATAISAVLVWYGTAAMVRQSFPPPPYTVLPTPDFNHFGHYNGRVLDVRSGNARMDLTMTAATEPPIRTSPMIALMGPREQKVLLLSIDHTDLTLRYYMPALRLTLVQPDLRLRGALQGIAPGDTFTAATWHDSTDICLRLNATQRCGLGYTIGDGWKLIYYPEARPAWQLGLINTLWCAGCVTFVGFWSVRGRRGKAAANNGGGEKDGGEGAAMGRIAIAIAILGSVFVPIFTGLNATAVHEFIGVIGGIVLGRYVARKTAQGDDGTIRWTRPVC